MVEENRMRLIILCSGCKKELEVKDVVYTPLDELKISVEACHDKNCYVCGDCEELEAREIIEEKLEIANMGLDNALEKLKKLNGEG